jgi:hypothetical protein
MASSKRHKAPGRWLMAGLSGLAAAGFLGAILSGRHPSDASSAGAQAQQPAAVAAGDSGVDTTGLPPVLSQPSQSQSPLAQASPFAGPPRFRTRGS